MHTPLVQSLPTKQAEPSAQWLQSRPPQSVAVSVPFFVLSLQLAATQTSVWHTALWQSVPTLHAAPLPHGAHEPPQSCAVSAPFLVESVHVGTAHLPLLHTPLWQSPLTLQPNVSPHGPQLPPQSCAVSSPFCTRSLQAGT